MYSGMKIDKALSPSTLGEVPLTFIDVHRDTNSGMNWFIFITAAPSICVSRLFADGTWRYGRIYEYTNGLWYVYMIECSTELICPLPPTKLKWLICPLAPTKLKDLSCPLPTGQLGVPCLSVSSAHEIVRCLPLLETTRVMYCTVWQCSLVGILGRRTHCFIHVWKMEMLLI